MFQLAAALKSVTATFIVHVLNAMGEQPIEILNLGTGTKQTFYLNHSSRWT